MFFRKGMDIQIGTSTRQATTSISALESMEPSKFMGKDVSCIAIMKIDTTGYDINKDEIFQVAVSRYFYATDINKILGLKDHHSYILEIDGSIPKKVAYVTGINDEMLGATGLIDEEIEEAIDDLVEILNECDHIVCHHAGFVKGFIDNLELFERLNTPFLCSLTQIDWVYKEGYHASNLQGILLQNNVFFENKDTAQYLDAIAFLLAQEPRCIDNNTYLECLLEDIKTEYYHVEAVGASFHTKDKLKSNGYFWNPGKKVWYKTVIIDEMDLESAWLQTEIYGGRDVSKKTVITPSERFNR